MCQHSKGYSHFALFVTLTSPKSRASACFHETQNSCQRHTGRFPVPGSAQSRVRRVSKIGPGWSGYYLVGVFKKVTFFFSKAIQTILLTAWLLKTHWKSFFFHPVLNSYFQLIPTVSCPAAIDSSEQLCASSGNLPKGSGRLFETHPKPSLLQAEWHQRHSSHQLSLTGQTLQSLSTLRTPDSSPSITSPLCAHKCARRGTAVVFPRTGVMLTSRQLSQLLFWPFLDTGSLFLFISLSCFLGAS